MRRKLRLISLRSLGGKVMTLLGIGLLSSMIIFSLSVFYFVNRTESEAWRGRQAEAARSAVGTVSGFVSRVEDSLTVVGILEPDYLVKDSDELNALLSHNQALLEVIRTDSDGVVMASAYRGNSVLANLITIPQSQWFLQARAGHVYIGSIQLSSTNEPYLIMAVPTPEGGVTAARVKMNVLWEVVKTIHFGDKGKAYVVTRSGQIVAHTDPTVVINSTSIQWRPEFEALIKAPNNQWSGTFVDLDGNWVVGSTQFIRGTDWVIVTELPLQEAFSSTSSAIYVLGTEAFLLMLAVSWITAGYVRRMIVDPMEQLRQGAETIGQGNLDFQIVIDRRDEIGELATAFNQMAEALARRDRELAQQTDALKTSELRYKAIVEDQTELICRFLPDGTLSFVNEAYCRYFDKSRQELIGHSFLPLIPEEDQPEIQTQIASLSPRKPVATYEHRVILQDGSIRWQRWTDRVLFDGQGNVQEYASVGRDITEQKQAVDELQRLNAELEHRVRDRTAALLLANEKLVVEVNERKAAEEQVRESLQEKEVLLKEIHHRVKNNLQIISSLLNLQANRVSDQRTLQALGDSQARVRSMALIHEKLYQSQSLAEIDFGEYVRSLASDLFRSYRRNFTAVQLDVQTDEVSLELDLAVSCGLILNELMTNALKYAFPDGKHGTISVELRATPARVVQLRVADDGVGIPADLDITRTKSLGLHLVNNLVAQLDGKLDLDSSAGTAFQVTFGY
jgi:PAS domain S-box-containing protein